MFKKINNFSTPPLSRGHKGLGEILRWVVNSHNPGFKNSAEEIPKEKVRQRKSELSRAVPGRLPIAFHLSPRRAPHTCGVLAPSGPTPSSHLAPARHQQPGHGEVPLYPNLCPTGSSDPPQHPRLQLRSRSGAGSRSERRLLTSCFSSRVSQCVVQTWRGNDLIRAGKREAGELATCHLLIFHITKKKKNNL